MPDPEKGQAGIQQPPPKPTFTELYAKGWETIEADEAAAAAGKTEAKPAAEPKKEEPECPDCPGGKPFKVIKHNGKDVFIKTEKEYNDLVQMGFDYTKKTQALAEERKKFDAERQAGQGDLLARLERLEREKEAAKPKPDKTADAPVGKIDKAALYAKYGLDEEYASDFDKRVVDDLVNVKEENQKLRQITQVMVVKDITKSISDSLAEAAKEFEIQDVLDDKGESMTGQLVISAFRQIIQDPANAQVPVAKLAREAVKRVHEAQSRTQGTVETVSDDMSEEDFAKKYPKLYAKLSKNGGTKAVAEFIKETEDLPPTIDARKGDIATADKPDKSKPKFKSLSEAIDAGLDDPEVSAIFNR